jgi:hypothetical protein
VAFATNPLLLALLLVSLVPLALMGYATYRSASQALDVEARGKLTVVREITVKQVERYFAGLHDHLRVLADEGVVKMFGNPGTTELPIMHALSSAPEMGYVLALQEAVVIAMADGYARASYKLVSCNVHVAPGLGNAIGSIYTSMMSGTPMIVVS